MKLRRRTSGTRGLVIARRFANIDPQAIRAVLVAGHAPFTWGQDAAEAAHLAFMLAELAQLAFMTITVAGEGLGQLQLGPSVERG
jgi:L-ribulose-5-phosphate 4-epimerase